MASSLPLVTTGLRRPASTSSDGHGGTRPNGGEQRNEDPLSWCAWAHQGHRLWEAMPDSFWVYTYKVERCPLPGNHVWTSCPYAHRGEHARRRDPRSFSYAATPCPEYEESKRRRLGLAAGSSATPPPPTCPRGLRCGYAHNVFETWLHPTRFRTVMCQRGAECSRRICFFAHSLAQRRREDDEVPVVVFPVTQPAPAFVPRAATSSASSPSSRSPIVVSRPVDRVAQALQQGHSVRILTRRRSDADAADASSSSSSALATITTAAAPMTTPVPMSAPLLQASPSSPVDDEDFDFVAIVTSCCRASEADSKAEGSGYPHFGLFTDTMRT